MKVLAHAPIRISLFGGGTDVGQYAEEFGGICINMAINIRQKFLLTNEDDILKLTPQDSFRFIKAFTKDYGVRHSFDGNIRSGLGTSASAAVAMVAGVARLEEDSLTRAEIAERAWEIEVKKLKLFGGRQDQYSAAYGGFNLMKFGVGVSVDPFKRKVAEKVANNILLFDTGMRRKDPKIQDNLKKITTKQRRALNYLKGTANAAKHAINLGDVDTIGLMLRETWNYKKKSNKVTTPEIDRIYKKAKNLGALGGKLCGSGGGGYMIFLVKRDKHINFINKIGLDHYDFEIDWQGVDTRFV